MKVRLLGILLLLKMSLVAASAQKPAALVWHQVIVSPSIPQDTRGETVYEFQGESQKDIPLVQGEVGPPVLLKQAKLHYPKRLAKARSEADVTVQGVVAQNGDYIDLTIVGPSDSEASAIVLSTVSKYKFQPATLDGEPIATLMKIVVTFRLK